MGRFEIILDSDQPFYTPEDTISGRIVAQFANTINVREITVSLRCRTLVELVYFFSGVWEHPAAEELNFQIDACVFPPTELSSQQVFSFKKGRHEWPFAFPLATVAPLLLPTCRGRNEDSSDSNCYYSIYCDLTARLQRNSRWKRNLTSVMSINLTPTSDKFALESACPVPTFCKLNFMRQTSEQTVLRKFRRRSQDPIPIEIGILAPPFIGPSPRKVDLQLQLSSPEPVRIESISICLLQRIDVRLFDCNYEGHATSCFGKVTKKVGRVDTQLDLSKFVTDFEFSSTLPSFISSLVRCRHALVFDLHISDPERQLDPQTVQFQVPVEVASPYESQSVPTYSQAIQEAAQVSEVA